VNWFASLWRTGRRIVSLPAQWWNQRSRRKPTPYRYTYVEDFPNVLETHKLYVAGENGYFWAAVMLCPCGCKDVIELNLLRKARPCWTVHEHQDGLVSLMPSVRRREGCKSHFYLRRGQIEWCRMYSPEASEGG
jgi:hypothetical protein